jgi:hypothetical protein
MRSKCRRYSFERLAIALLGQLDETTQVVGAVRATRS